MGKLKATSTPGAKKTLKRPSTTASDSKKKAKSSRPSPSISSEQTPVLVMTPLRMLLSNTMVPPPKFQPVEKDPTMLTPVKPTVV